MRLFHVSEDPHIEVFHPIIPYRQDLDQSTGLVWALCERTLPNFFTPRDCPRVTYHISKDTTKEDRQRYFSSRETRHCVAIEKRWVERMKKTKLTVYEFDSKNFILQDEDAGFYVSKETERPINQYQVNDLFQELKKYHVEVKILDELFTLRDQIIDSSFHWSMCRMKNARKDD